MGVCQRLNLIILSLKIVYTCKVELLCRKWVWNRWRKIWENLQIFFGYDSLFKKHKSLFEKHVLYLKNPNKTVDAICFLHLLLFWGLENSFEKRKLVKWAGEPTNNTTKCCVLTYFSYFYIFIKKIISECFDFNTYLTFVVFELHFCPPDGDWWKNAVVLNMA